MLTAISTNVPVPTRAPAQTVMKSVCSCAVILSCLTPGFTSTVPLQQVKIESPTLVSTDFINQSTYYNGNTCFSWDGVSVMSVDRAKSLLRIIEIEKLQNNWNGNGAESFSKAILATAKSIILQLSVQPHIFPTARDSIQFEYENALGDYLEFELFENDQLKMFYFNHLGNAETTYIAVSEMNEVVNKFYGRNI